MDSSLKVSVIIPIWGVEQYIERCARSLFEQSMDSIEFIFVDDCTPDNSIDILRRVIEDYPERQNNIKILHHENNKGLPEARQTGLKEAVGEYIIHCDSDDWVDKDLYEVMYKKAVAEDLDVVVCQMKETDGSIMYDISLFPDSDKKHITNHPSNWINEGSLCNKLFRRSVYKSDIVTPVVAMAEDKCLVLQLVYYCKSIGVVYDHNYYIWKNPTSIIRTATEERKFKNFKDGVANYQIIENFYKEHNALDSTVEDAFFRLKYKLRDNLRSILKNQKYYKIWMTTFPELNKGILSNNRLTSREKIRSILIKYRLFPFPWSQK